MNTLLATLPIFLIIAAGFGLTRAHIAQNRWIRPLNNFVYFIALPALTILSLIQLDLSQPTLQLTLLITVLISMLGGITFAGISRLLPFPKKTQITIFLTATLGNTVFLGIPLATALTPDVAAATVATLSVIFFTTALVTSLIIIELWLKKSQRDSHMLRSLTLNPVIISLFIGIICAPIPIPRTFLKLIETPIQLIAQTASPLALFALGGFLAHHHVSHKRWPAIIIATGLKLCVLPLIFFIALVILKPTTDLAALSLLFAATPTAVTAFVLTEKYKLDSELAAGVMLVSTLLAMISLPFLMNLP